MTTTMPEIDVTNIEHLDFDVPCDSDTCNGVAAWLITWKGEAATLTCCRPVRVICDGCCHFFRQGSQHNALLVCRHRPLGLVRDLLSRLEPL